MRADAALAEARQLLQGEPVFLAGSLVAAEVHDKQEAWSDVDIFCPSSEILIATGQRLLDAGYVMDDRYSRVWARWLRYGFKSWHTNSLRMESLTGVETNLVYKMADGHPTTSLAQVLESFDFGLLGMGWDMEQDQFRDLRPFLFPVEYAYRPSTTALPMMPNKRSNWRNGFISQYNGLREAGRYAKYHTYGYDLTWVKDDLVEGYQAASLYLTDHFDAEKQLLGKIYEVIGLKIEGDAILELQDAAAQIDYKDSLDVIMEALE